MTLAYTDWYSKPRRNISYNRTHSFFLRHYNEIEYLISKVDRFVCRRHVELVSLLWFVSLSIFIWDKRIWLRHRIMIWKNFISFFLTWWNDNILLLNGIWNIMRKKKKESSKFSFFFIEKQKHNWFCERRTANARGQRTWRYFILTGC